MKICKTCKKLKENTEFYRYKYSKDRLCYVCKKCRNEITRKWYYKNQEKYKKLMVKWKKENPKKYKKTKRNSYINYRKKYPERVLVKIEFQKSLRKGIIKKYPCEVCGDTKSQGHHPDYSKPLEVIWLCQKHHSELHAKLRNKI